MWKCILMISLIHSQMCTIITISQKYPYISGSPPITTIVSLSGGLPLHQATWQLDTGKQNWSPFSHVKNIKTSQNQQVKSGSPKQPNLQNTLPPELSNNWYIPEPPTLTSPQQSLTPPSLLPSPSPSFPSTPPSSSPSPGCGPSPYTPSVLAFGASQLSFTPQNSRQVPQPINIDYQTYLQLFKTQQLQGMQSSIYTISGSASNTRENILNPSISSQQADQYRYRELIFMNNVGYINTFNQEGSSYTMGLNQFTDLSVQQFTQIYTKLIVPEQEQQIVVDTSGQKTQQTQSEYMQQIQIDWTCKSTQIFTQGMCGSCYIAAALDSVQISSAINNRPMVSLSVQEILSCGKTSMYPNIMGCDGGYFDSVFNYVIRSGVGPSLFYPYSPTVRDTGVDDPCDQNLVNDTLYKRNKVFIYNYGRIPKGDCQAVVKLLEKQTISVGLSSDGLQFYQSGTFVPSPGRSSVINHAAVLIGYHPTKGYLIKNSWGTTWGERGYGWVDESVGICQHAMYPILTLMQTNSQLN